MFFLRSTLTTGMDDLLGSFDSITREALSSILGGPVSDLEWRQSKLPTSMGGCGLQAAQDLAPIAFTTSYLSSFSRVNDLLHPGEDEPHIILQQPLLDSLSAKLGEAIEVESMSGLSQKQATYKMNELQQSLLLDDFTTEGEQRELARMRCLSNAHTGDWLRATPSASLGLLLRGQEFTMALKYRLGIPLLPSVEPCPACHQPLDTMGDHALGCGSNGERIARHNLLRDALHQAAGAASLAPVKEGRFLLPGQNARPADILIPGWSGGRDAALDVTIVSPLQQAMVRGASEVDGYALNEAFRRKVAKAGEPCRQQGISFIPLAADTFGGWHGVAIEQVQKIGRALARQSGEDEDQTTRHLFQKLSLLLMKGNSALLINRVPVVDVDPAIGGWE